MQKEQKREFVKQFNSILKDKEFMLVADYKGLNVSQISSLREQISSANSNFRVAKNTLARMAIKNTSFQMLDKLFDGKLAGWWNAEVGINLLIRVRSGPGINSGGGGPFLIRINLYSSFGDVGTCFIQRGELKLPKKSNPNL